MPRPNRKTPPKVRRPRNSGSARPQRRAGVPARAVLFAPWRIEFILGPKERGCFLCQAARLPAGDEAAWKRRLLLHRAGGALVILNRYPYTGGHLLVAPLRHTADLAGLREEESRALWELSRRSVDILGRVLKPQGYNLGLNLGKAAGAGVEDHLHLHALPRWIGDTNFLPVASGTSTIPVALEALWDDLRPAFRSLRIPG